MKRPSVLQGLVELLAPTRCIGCDSLAADEEDCIAISQTGGFCRGCFPSLELAPEPLRPPSESLALFTYDGPVAHAVRHMKYHQRPHLSRPLGELLAAFARRSPHEVDAVVPVPMHTSKLRQRGYNPAALLAVHVARGLGAPMRRWISRVRPTDAQASLRQEERARNLRGAFRAHPHVHGRHLLLVDDVRTTGATLAEMGHTALKAGAASCHSVTLAYRALHHDAM
jgi:ComF family protein